MNSENANVFDSSDAILLEYVKDHPDWAVRELRLLHGDSRLMYRHMAIMRDVAGQMRAWAAPLEHSSGKVMVLHWANTLEGDNG